MSENSEIGKLNVATVDFTTFPETYTPPESHKDLRSAKREPIDLYRVIVHKDYQGKLINSLDDERKKHIDDFVADLHSYGIKMALKWK